MSINNLSLKNFEPYDYQTTNEILQKNFILNHCGQKNDDKILVLCIGVNGSGKSTYLANLYEKTSFNLPYFNADILAQSMPKYEKPLASKEATEMANRFIDCGRSFCFESVFTHPSKLELVIKAKKQGYKIVGIYIFAETSEINKNRVAERVEQGGHGISPEKIEERFNKMRGAVCGLIPYCNELYFFDNSKDLQLINKINEKDGRECCQA